MKLRENVGSADKKLMEKYCAWLKQGETCKTYTCQWGLQKMKNLSILSLKLFFLFETSLWEAKQSVCSSIGLALAIINLKMVSRKLLGPPDLIKAQTLYIYKLTKVVVVGQDKDLVFAVF